MDLKNIDITKIDDHEAQDGFCFSLPGLYDYFVTTILYEKDSTFMDVDVTSSLHTSCVPMKINLRATYDLASGVEFSWETT